jgi:hypothetical protein
VNIGTKENLNFANIRYYCNDETAENVEDLLHEY